MHRRGDRRGDWRSPRCPDVDAPDAGVRSHDAQPHLHGSDSNAVPDLFPAHVHHGLCHRAVRVRHAHGDADSDGNC